MRAESAREIAGKMWVRKKKTLGEIKKDAAFLRRYHLYAKIAEDAVRGRKTGRRPVDAYCIALEQGIGHARLVRAIDAVSEGRAVVIPKSQSECVRSRAWENFFTLRADGATIEEVARECGASTSVVQSTLFSKNAAIAQKWAAMDNDEKMKIVIGLFDKGFASTQSVAVQLGLGRHYSSTESDPGGIKALLRAKGIDVDGALENGRRVFVNNISGMLKKGMSYKDIGQELRVGAKRVRCVALEEKRRPQIDKMRMADMREKDIAAVLGLSAPRIRQIAPLDIKLEIIRDLVERCAGFEEICKALPGLSQKRVKQLIKKAERQDVARVSRALDATGRVVR